MIDKSKLINIKYMEQTLAEILEAVKMKMENQGEYSRAAYRTYIEEAIDDFMRAGIVTDDDDIEMMEDKLLLAYNDTVAAMSEFD
jgi:hypothetical protein